MKKLNYLLLGAAALAMASCSQEELTSPASDGNLSVTVTLPDGALATRSFGDGFTANNLHYAVYDANNNYALVDDGFTNFPADQLETTVKFNLANGKSYYIAFFAQSAESQQNGAYTFNAADHMVYADYSKMNSNYNQDLYDCFFQVYTTGVIGVDSQDATITLYRPVCQVNWGTDDLDAKVVTDAGAYGTGAKYLVSQVTTKAYTNFDMLAMNDNDEVVGDVEGATSDVTLAYLPRPASGETFPVEDYEYVSMQYLLAPKASTLYDLTLTVSNQDNPDVATPTTQEVKVNSAPVQANYRTNIYGSLLTDELNYKVVKDPNWNEPDYDIILNWDGTSTTPTIVGNTVYVQKASDLKGLADMVNGGETLKGYTVELSSDFNMSGYDFPGIGSATRSSGNATGNVFQGVFDGNGHTISNLAISYDGNEGDTSVGFIPNLDGSDAALKNVNFSSVNIQGGVAEQAGVVGIVTNGATISNVTVTGHVSSKEAGAGIAGRILKSGTITSCVNNANVTVTDYNAGGIVGAAYYTQTGTTMQVSGCTNNGTITSVTSVGGIAGLSCAEVSGCTNNGKVNGGASSVGGVVGEQNTAGFVKDCVNTADVQITDFASTAYGTGGVVGWVRYNALGTSYERQNSIEVTGCTNYGSVSGNTGVGGIVGTWYMCGNCSGNFNYAPSLVAANTFVAGIVGDSQWTGVQPTGFTPNDLLTVNNNKTSTTLEQMKGGLATLYVYINNNAKTTESGNKVVEPQTATKN